MAVSSKDSRSPVQINQHTDRYIVTRRDPKEGVYRGAHDTMVGVFCCDGGGTKVRCYEHCRRRTGGQEGQKKGGDPRRKARAIKEAPVQTMGIKHLNMKVFAITILLALVATTYAGYISSGWSGGGGGWSGGGGGWSGGGGGGWRYGGGGGGGGGGGKIIKVITVSGGGGGGWPSGGGGGWPSGGGGGWKGGWSGGGGGGGWSGGGGGGGWW